MHEECATESPTKKRSYAMRLLPGWMPQLDYVAIFGCLVRVGIRQGSVVYIKTVCFSFKTNHILRCLNSYQLRSLLRHKYHIRQSILFFHTNYCFIIQQTRIFRNLQRSVRLRTYPPDCATAPQCRGRITEVGSSWAGAVGVAQFGGLAYAKERLALYVHQLKERSVGGGVDAVERSVGIASIQLAVLADCAALVVKVSHIQ